MADSTAPKPEKKKAQRVGVDTCLLCINTVADADKLKQLGWWSAFTLR